MRRQVDVATMTISRGERRSDPQSTLLRGQKREVFGLSATYPLIEVLLKINRSIWHPLLEKNHPKANAKDTVSSFPKTGKQHLTLRPATHLPRSNHRLLWAAIMHTSHCLLSSLLLAIFDIFFRSRVIHHFVAKKGQNLKCPRVLNRNFISKTNLKKSRARLFTPQTLLAENTRRKS